MKFIAREFEGMICGLSCIAWVNPAEEGCKIIFEENDGAHCYPFDVVVDPSPPR
jgi:hypothetical protein